MDNNFVLTPESLKALTDSLSRFEKTISATYASVLREQVEAAHQTLSELVESISNSIKSMLSDTMNSYDISERSAMFLKDQASKALVSVTDIRTYLADIGFSKISEGITVSGDIVELSDATLDNATKLVGQINPNATLSNRMSYKEFLLMILYPLFLVLIPMIFSLYQQKQSNATESEKIQLLQEQNDLLSEIVKQNSESDTQISDTINEILYRLKSLQDNLPVSEELPETAPDSVNEVP